MQLKPQIIAHRGGGGETVENTRESILYALSLKVSRFETDVRTLKDGTVVLQHDAQLQNPWGDWRKVGELTSQEYFALRGPQGQCPISLKSALEDFPNLAYNIDIKEPRALQGALQAVNDADAWERVVFSSFSPKTLCEIRNRHPHAQICLSTHEVLKAVVAARTGNTYLFQTSGGFAQVPLRWWGVTIVDREFVAWNHCRGIRVEPWTVNDEPAMRELARLGVDAIMTDYPARLKKVLATL
ncbi:glycerophosphodiester phosphodiesterase family protein [Varibaculum vaginae]|uniref:glycerophosphodiester phosphodiesterase family protein n=1 Tax=Varibaculum vaginae TaxID=2364797 RepID=UPI000F087AB2|nr:glycerophosphodiester phosphodiesterase family protein [Varibaculum vaginae]